MPEAEKKKIKYTAPVRRGLGLVRLVALTALRDDLPPADKVVERMSVPQRREFNQALEYIEQEEEGNENWEALGWKVPK